MPVAYESQETRRRAATEARTESIVRSSHLFRMADRALAIVTAAWTHSIAGAMSRQVFDRAKQRTMAERVCLTGGVTAVASATALALQRLAPRPAPFVWIVPAIFLCVGAGLIAVARERPAR